MDRVSIERMFSGKEFHVEGADREKAREEKLLVIPAGLVRRLVLDWTYLAKTPNCMRVLNHVASTKLELCANNATLLLSHFHVHRNINVTA